MPFAIEVVPRSIRELDQFGADQRFERQHVDDIVKRSFAVLQRLAQFACDIKAGWEGHVPGKFAGDVFQHLKALHIEGIAGFVRIDGRARSVERGHSIRKNPAWRARFVQFSTGCHVVGAEGFEPPTSSL